MDCHRPFDANLGAALLAFNADFSVFCEGILEFTAQQYAIAFARRLVEQAKGFEATQPGEPSNLSKAHLRMIKTRLRHMYRKHFPG